MVITQFMLEGLKIENTKISQLGSCVASPVCRRQVTPDDDRQPAPGHGPRVSQVVPHQPGNQDYVRFVCSNNTTRYFDR